MAEINLLVGEASVNKLDKADAIPKLDRSLPERLHARIAEGNATIEALEKRQINRRKFAVSSGNGSRTLQMLNVAKPYRVAASEALDADLLAFNVRDDTLRFVKRLNPDAKRDDAADIWAVELQQHTPTI